MGMYTGLRINGIVKPEYREEIELLYSLEVDFGWRDLSYLSPRYYDLASKQRCDSIPFGALAYMPDEWDEGVNSYNNATGQWIFACSLKNYDDEIESFLNIVPDIFESLELCEHYYEEWSESILCILEDGELKMNGGIVYDESLLAEEQARIRQ